MYRYLAILCILFSLQAHAAQPEPLNYRLSYSGFITGFIWKELADVTLQLEPQQTSFRDNNALQLSMEVNSSNYRFTEMLHSVRYRWQSTVSEDLKRSLMVRITDDGDSDSHDAFWYDWDNNFIAAYEKRSQIDTSILLVDEEPKLEWQKDILPAPPKFVDPYPPVAEGLGYLIQSKQIPGMLNADAIDPLTMLLKLRRHDYRKHKKVNLIILHEDDVAPYQARLLATESLQMGDKAIPALKIEVRRSNESGEEGVMHYWLSDDEQRLPLRLDLDAPLGELHVVLQQAEEQSGSTTRMAGHTNANR